MLIGLTDPLTRIAARRQAYASWLQRGLKGAEIVWLSPAPDSDGMLDSCDALVLSGGGDVDPVLYGLPDEARHRARGVSRARDDFEIALLRRAMERGMPVLGICRGLQVTNVALGGTLVPDLPDIGCNGHRAPDDESPAHHMIFIEKGTLLESIAGASEAVVNSYHHQAVERVAEGLRVAARSGDGVVEAIERREGQGSRFFLAVQWHPERSAQNDPLGLAILERLAMHLQHHTVS